MCAYQNKDEGIQVPLIRVMKNDGKVSESSYFIDHVGRVYDDWSHFLKENVHINQILLSRQINFSVNK